MDKPALQMRTIILHVARKGTYIPLAISSHRPPIPQFSANTHSSAVCTGTAPASAPTAPVGTVTYVPNSYFPFPYVPTTFGNRASCSSAVQSCSKNYDACLTKLQDGNGYHVTVAVPGASGTTVTGGATSLPAVQATSICSSLSLEACRALTSATCASISKSSGAKQAAPISSMWLLALLPVSVIYQMG